MKILYVTKALLAPPHAGCMQRTTHIVRQLQRCCGDVTMLASMGVLTRLGQPLPASLTALTR